MPRDLPRYVRVKRAKGKTYYYFDTGAKNDIGKPILSRLPDIRDRSFGQMLAAAQGARTRRGQVRDVLTISRLADLFEKSHEFRAYKPATRQSYELYLDQIRGRLGGAPAGLLESQDVMLVRDEMADRSGAANQFVATLGSLYKWGRQRGYVSTNPTLGIKKLQRNPHEKWPEMLLQDALAAPEVQLPVAMLYYTAQRIGDVCQMRWTDIRNGALVITQQKTGKRLTLPLHAELSRLLAAEPRRGLTILSRPDGRAWEPHPLRDMLQAWARRHGHKVVPHGLRKNAVIALLECGCSIAETAAISGQTLQMVEHYAQDRNQGRLASAAILRWEGNK